jgi:transcriptional regulator with GAF, ATPase, and Fis domain
LLESELFGYERGAFTGASQQKCGWFETARGGTLFLDEISNLPLASQAKLLRVLQNKVVCHLGGTRPIHVDVRLLVATNLDLQRLVEDGSFRRDLYFRLNEFIIRIPPLRQRREDILYLARQFLEITNGELSKQVQGFTADAIRVMVAYGWPGNVRQLRSVIRRAVLMADESITEQHLDLPVAPPSRPVALEGETELPLREIVKRQTACVERAIIAETLRRAGGNKAKAARVLHVDYKTMHSKVKEYGIEINGEQNYGQEE